MQLQTIKVEYDGAEGVASISVRAFDEGDAIARLNAWATAQLDGDDIGIPAEELFAARPPTWEAT